jgi:hypothetical protein
LSSWIPKCYSYSSQDENEESENPNGFVAAFSRLGCFLFPQTLSGFLAHFLRAKSSYVFWNGSTVFFRKLFTFYYYFQNPILVGGIQLKTLGGAR